ncbi:MAG: sigma-70 family RNA polymerase sigma factor [Muribaculaceae bacterium]|nr:sigma-70 family RNA polymerase sigma factor [Muribaculaceae bacterium]
MAIRHIHEMERLEFEHIAKIIRPKLKNKAFLILHDEAEAEDIVQDALLKLWTIRNRLDEYQSIEALAMVIMQRLCLDVLKRRRNDTYKGEEPQEMEYSPHEELERIESGTQVDAILAQLPDKQSAILRMKHIDMLETKEIATILGMSEGAIRITLMRARNKVKELFLNKKR